MVTTQVPQVTGKGRPRKTVPSARSMGWQCLRIVDRGIVKTCGSACHTLLPARRVADHADLRYRLGRGYVLGPQPGQAGPPDSRNLTAMSFAVVSVCTHTPDQLYSRRAA